MDKFTINCTEAQTKKALELGAPLYMQTVDDNEESIEVYENGRYDYFEIPTAEQMISWLEKQDIFVSINHISEGYSSWLKTISTNENISENLGYVSSRKEATLAAIDAALEYLTDNK